MRLFLIILSLPLFVLGIFLSIYSNMNLGTVLILLLGTFFMICGLFYSRLKLLTKSGLFRYIKYLVIFMLAAETALVCFIALFGQTDNVSYSEDAVIVLGAGVRGEDVTLPLKLRLDKAVEYSKKNPDAVIIVTGGQGFQEAVTEASAMEKYLISMGVDRTRIIKEEKATSTNENMRFSAKLLEERFGAGYSAAVITNGFHIYRSVSIARSEGITNATHMHAGLQWYNIPPCYLRESLAVIKMWVIG